MRKRWRSSGYFTLKRKHSKTDTNKDLTTIRNPLKRPKLSLRPNKHEKDLRENKQVTILPPHQDQMTFKSKQATLPPIAGSFLANTPKTECQFCRQILTWALNFPLSGLFKKFKLGKKLMGRMLQNSWPAPQSQAFP